MRIPGLVYSDEVRRHFASDNNSPAHPAVMEAVAAANRGHTIAYGDDYYTQRALGRMREVFGAECEAFFVYTGTGANVLSLAALTRRYEAVICAADAHINVAECGGPEQLAGVKLLTAASETGKITVGDIERLLVDADDPHRVLPRVVSLTQATDFGAAYTVEEVAQICAFAHSRGLYVHMDGARLYTACAAQGATLAAMTTEAGVDVLSLGGTKNGLLGAEAVVFPRPGLAEGFERVRKQGTQLASKMRYLAVQVEALLTDDLWLANARHANRMAELLAEGLRAIEGVEITRPVETNMVYCMIPAEAIEAIRRRYLFYVYDPQRSEVRLVTSWDTRQEDVEGFVAVTREAVGRMGQR